MTQEEFRDIKTRIDKLREEIRRIENLESSKNHAKHKIQEKKL